MAKFLGICFTLSLLSLAFAQDSDSDDQGIPFEDLSIYNTGRRPQEIPFFGSANEEGASSSAGGENYYPELNTNSEFPGAPTPQEGDVAEASDPLRSYIEETLSKKPPHIRQKFEKTAKKELARAVKKEEERRIAEIVAATTQAQREAEAREEESRALQAAEADVEQSEEESARIAAAVARGRRMNYRLEKAKAKKQKN